MACNSLKGRHRLHGTKKLTVDITASAPNALFWLEAEARRSGIPSRYPAWLTILKEGFGHEPMLLVARENDGVVGSLPLALVSSCLFGRFLVSLPYLNTGGIIADNDAAATLLLDRAVRIADELDVRFLELRHERRWKHPSLNAELTNKVHMRLGLPATSNVLWTQLKAKVRNQVRKGRESGFTIHWGAELLDEFYAVFSRNMRDLGTPVVGRKLFRAIVAHLPGQAEFCIVRDGSRPVAAALLLHGQGITEVPSASSLKEYNSSNANMLMYWHLLERAMERDQHTFDFGRSTVDSNTFRFKKQWGAEPFPAVWQYYVRRGSVGDMRPENSRYRFLVRLWRRLPLRLANLIGPAIVQGIP